MEIKTTIERINFLARKKKNEGLTAEEQAEQKELYRLYLGNIRSQLKSELDRIVVVDEPSPKLH
ncbi:MAG: DUF896 domain-containing protein [Acidaminococcaceae bacterium]|nr:DUF896 domain-containing protein [Acidaminococcaceae bacterium]